MQNLMVVSTTQNQKVIKYEIICVVSSITTNKVRLFVNSILPVLIYLNVIDTLL